MHKFNQVAKALDFCWYHQVASLTSAGTITREAFNLEFKIKNNRQKTNKLQPKKQKLTVNTDAFADAIDNVIRCLRYTKHAACNNI